MADTYTKIADLIDPEVMGDMVSARIPKKLRVAPFAKVDDTLAGVPGDTITVPAYAYIGDADIVAEGEAVTIEKMTTSTRKATVKKAMKGIGLTDEAVLSGYGNPVGEANTQLAMAIAAKIDNDCMDVLQTATLTPSAALCGQSWQCTKPCPQRISCAATVQQTLSSGWCGRQSPAPRCCPPLPLRNMPPRWKPQTAPSGGISCGKAKILR